MNRFALSVLLALLAGFGAGLAHAWLISPLRVTDTEPATLRADFKDQYRAAIASAYAADGNLPRARERLALLGDSNPIEALNAQAQRTVAGGGTSQQADQLAALAFALENGANPISSLSNAGAIETANSPGQAIETRTSPIINTLLPTQTLIPTLGAPFELIEQDSTCDSSLPEGLLQVMILDSSGRQMPGIRIVITWDAGEEQFYTGFKPEFGNGYADFVMTPNVTYSLQLALGSEVATGLVAPTCLSPGGKTFWGGFSLTFQQP